MKPYLPLAALALLGAPEARATSPAPGADGVRTGGPVAVVGEAGAPAVHRAGVRLAQGGPLVLPGASTGAPPAEPAPAAEAPAPRKLKIKPSALPKPPAETVNPQAPSPGQAASEPDGASARPGKPPSSKALAAGSGKTAAPKPPAEPPPPAPEALPGFEHLPPPAPKPPDPPPLPALAKPKPGKGKPQGQEGDPAEAAAASPSPPAMPLGTMPDMSATTAAVPIVLPSTTRAALGGFGLGETRLQPVVLSDPGLLVRGRLMLGEPVLTNPNQWEDPEGWGRTVRTATTPTVRPLHPMLAFVAGLETLYALRMEPVDSLDAPLALNSIEALRQGVPVGPFRAGLIEENASGAPRIETGTVIWQLEGVGPESATRGARSIRAVASLGRAPVRAVLTLRNEPAEAGAGPLTMDLELTVPDDAVVQAGIPELRNAGIDRGVALFARAAMAGEHVRFAFPLDQADGDANVRLLATRSWIDIPVRLRSGRRLVIALEKGTAVRDMIRETFRLWRLPWLP